MKFSYLSACYFRLINTFKLCGSESMCKITLLVYPTVKIKTYRYILKMHVTVGEVFICISHIYSPFHLLHLSVITCSLPPLLKLMPLHLFPVAPIVGRD